MKMYQLKSIFSIICFISSGFCAALAIVCAIEWSAMRESISFALCIVGYLYIGLCAKKGAQEDYEDYIEQRDVVKNNYDKLSYMFKQYYWTLDVDSLVPSLKNKKRLLEWCADVAVACQAYQHDYNTSINNQQADLDLKTMIKLAQELIENKQYI